MNKQLVIPCSRMILVLNESELIEGLKPETLERGIRQGKGYRRAATCEKRQANVDFVGMEIFLPPFAATCEKRQANVDRWRLYEWLKGNKIPENVASLIETMPTTELREGVIEFILTRERKEKML